MSAVMQILQDKSSNVWSISPTATAYDALEIMAEKNIGALLVMEEQRLVGIFSERDYARKVILKGKASKETPVNELMSTDLVTIDPDASIGECMELMTSKRIRHLPVVANEKIVGIVTIGDVVNKIIIEQKTKIGQLENFIYGNV